ncbi:helix-turn-helix domain-containing protein, partial [Methylobacterium sp. BTF04]|uniref:helix-turn-helix domain-containing protein n=1 Tax=Methylobacterium sp. BTF04 TaxID=2708300 RepID=UPI0013D353E0
EKVAAFLIGLQERYVRIGRSSVTLELPMGRLDIADHLGLTIETVSRTMARLDRDGCIMVVPGGVRLIDQVRLDRMSAH